MTEQTPAGFYDDGSGTERWFDGQSWGITHAEALAPAQQAPETQPVAPAVAVVVAPGWYNDGTGQTRWWDGGQWTSHYPLIPGRAEVVPVMVVSRPRRLWSKTARVTFWCGVAAVAFPPFAFAALILGPFAIMDVRKTGKRGMGSAIAGMLIASITLVVLTTVLVLDIRAQNTPHM